MLRLNIVMLRLFIDRTEQLSFTLSLFMKKINLLLSFVILFSTLALSQNNILVIDYNNNFSSDQQNNASNIYNRLLATQTSVVRVNAIPATINPATYNQVWIFGNMGTPAPATLNPIVNYMNAGGAVYIQSEVGCCNNEASFADQIINLTTLAGGAITHIITKTGNYQYQPSTTLVCTPWVNHGAALRPFVGTPANNILYAANNVCGTVITTGDIVGVKFASCDMISGQGALIVNGDFNIFPLSGTCGATGIMGTPNNNTVIDLMVNLFPTLVACGNPNPSTVTMTTPANITVCNGANVPTSAFTSNPTGATFAWTNSNTSIGLAASGSGNTPAFTAINTGITPVTSTITVTPSIACPGQSVTYTITITPSPAGPVVANATVCTNSSTTLTATAPGGNYQWFDAPVGGNLLASTSSFTTPNLTTTTSYYVQTTINGCLSVMTTVTVTISTNLIVNAGLDTTICFGANANLSVIPNGAGFSYSWTVVGNSTPFSTIFNPTVSPVTTTNYAVTVVNPNGCTGTDSVLVIVNPILTTTINSTNVTCNGICDGTIASIPVGGTAPYSYLWSNGATTSMVSNLCSGNYDVFITDAFGCTVFAATLITEPTLLQINLTSSTDPLCNGSCDGSITVNSNGGTGVYQYSIDGVTFQPSPTFTNQCAGNYTITVRDANLCIQTLNVVLNNPPALSITTITPVNVSCNQANNGTKNDGSISITAAGGTPPYNYSINNGTTFSSSSILNGLIIGTYTIVVTDANGCSGNGGNINITEPIAITIPSVVTDVLCFGASNGQVVVAPQGGTPAYSYSWSNGNGNNPLSANLPAGNITVTVTDINGCSQDLTEMINQPAPINFVTFSANLISGCVPLKIIFTNTTDTNLIASASWNFGNGITSANIIDSTIYSIPGTYDVSLTVTDNNGCVGILNQTNYITVYDNPTANFSSTPDNATIFDPTLFFTDLSQFNITSWNWHFDTLGNSSIQNPNFIFPSDDTATYLVTLLVIDNNGCTDSIIKPVKIFGESGVFVPNAFTPDGDNLNEFFMPKGFGITQNKYSFVIFNRWGEVIFESHQLDIGWDGSYKGTLVPVGVYVWKLNYNDVNGKSHSETGKVTIVK